MSEGATKSAPACAAKAAIPASTSTVSSFRIHFPEESRIPSWPCEVYGSSAMSATTTISGKRFLTAAIARFARDFGLTASSARGVFRAGSMSGKGAIARTPHLSDFSQSFKRESIVWRETPGIDGILTDPFLPSIINTGRIISAGSSLFSAQSDNIDAPLRSLLGLLGISSLNFSSIVF